MLHELSTCLQAPTVELSGADGQIRASGAQGVFSADVRVLSRAEVSVAQSPLEPIATIPGGADRATYIALLRRLGRPGADRWRDYAADLAGRFREPFWVTDDLGAYPALALDGEKNRVDAPASNMGHFCSGSRSMRRTEFSRSRLPRWPADSPCTA